MNSPEIIRKVLHSWGFKRWHGLADRWLSSRVCLGRGRWSEPAPQPRQGGDGSRTCCWPVLGAGGWVGWWQLLGTPWDWNKRNESGELAVLKGFHGENAAKGDKPYLNCLSHTPILHLSTTLKSIPLKSGVTGLSPEITKVLPLVQCRHISVLGLSEVDVLLLLQHTNYCLPPAEKSQLGV